MKRVIGLTGTMGAGKSEVSAYLRKKGIAVIDADEISRDITRKGQPGYEAVLRAFGRKFLSDNGEIDRRALGKYVFLKAERLNRLEEILHPLIIKRMEEELEKTEGTVVIDAPLLHKAGLDRLCGEVWVVSASETLRLERILARDRLTESEARARLKSQTAQEDMDAVADVVLKNEGAFEDLFKQIDEVLYG